MASKHVVTRAARLLGASRVVPLGKIDHTPIGMAALTERVRQLRSTGPGGTGRPSNPKATVPRIVKFKSAVWSRLQKEARNQARITGRQVSPAQVASMLLEEVLSRPKAKHRHAQ
ncbi:MAG TPA: hypothetical protein VMU54_22695 [Planctomycetota bacterium]|nr:hypothetical protein [Planctomycetota bacterium]